MSKKKDKYVYKKKVIPEIVEVLDERLLQDYIWERPSGDSIAATVYRHIGLGIRNPGDEPKAYWYIVETIYDHPQYPTVRKYGYVRRPQWDR